MSDIKIETVLVDDGGNVTVIGIVSDLIRVESISPLIDPPEYGPARVRVKIPSFYFVDEEDNDMDTKYMSDQALIDYIERNINTTMFDYRVEED